MMPGNNGYFDLSAVFNLEQNYLYDMCGAYQSVNNAPLLAQYVLNLQNNLKNVNKTFQDANTSSAAVLDQQQQMINIIDNEQHRLTEKQELIDQAKMQNERIAMLNYTYRKEYGEYTKMLIVLIIGLVIHILLRIIANTFMGAPTGLMVLLHIINIVVCMIVITIIYANLKTRSQINYDQLNLPGPNAASLHGPVTPASAPGSNKDPLFGVCFEQSCCGPNTVWNSTMKQCDVAASCPIPVPAATSTTAATSAGTAATESFTVRENFPQEAGSLW